MTTEERFERIEHATFRLAEERLRDHEEFRRLWRDTQGQINEGATRLNELTIMVADMDHRLGKRIEALAEESRAADRRLGERIESMLSATGEFIRVQGRKAERPARSGIRERTEKGGVRRASTIAVLTKPGRRNGRSSI
ncbi:MAG: hypothetical protein ABSH32_22885 [Bryobacteraceae bacterium]|jgi:hypothetical protein